MKDDDIALKLLTHEYETIYYITEEINSKSVRIMGIALELHRSVHI